MSDYRKLPRLSASIADISGSAAGSLTTGRDNLPTLSEQEKPGRLLACQLSDSYRWQRGNVTRDLSEPVPFVLVVSPDYLKCLSKESDPVRLFCQDPS